MNLDVNESYYEDYFKVIVVGDAATGKTNIIQAYDKGVKQNKIIPTVGIEYCSKVIQIDQNRKVKMQIWDTAGQQQFRSVTMGHYKNAAGALIVFDVGSRTSFSSIPRWVNDIRERCNENVAIGIIGHKIDLQTRNVSKEEGESMASREQAFYMETTIYDVQTIRNVFDRLAQEIFKSNKNKNLSFSRTNVQLNSNPSSKPATTDNCAC